MSVQLFAAVACVVVALSAGAPEKDLVTSLPEFTMPSFKVYSGYLKVPGPFMQTEYDNLFIHYEFHESQGNPSKDPVSTWHQGGPGGSSLYGAYTEMGFFQVFTNTTGAYGAATNKYAWNQVSNMLYLESPAGLDDPFGFSYCTKGGKIEAFCKWNDTSQAEAYAHTLLAFYKEFPEFASNDLYLTGESYAGQYLPNIAYFMLKEMPDKFPMFKGMAVGNGCWGGDATHVDCNGPNSDQNDLDMYFGKGLISKPLYTEAYQKCKFPEMDAACKMVLEKAFNEVGPHNVYDIYDNCPQTGLWIEKSGKSMRFLRNYLRDNLHRIGAAKEELKQYSGGYTWECGGMDAMSNYFRRTDVQKALHLGKIQPSQFMYDTSGPASVTLYPYLVKKIRVLIYNGDADSCVPYKGNEEYIDAMASNGIIKVNKDWHPWFVTMSSGVAGYATTYTVANSTTDFAFVTIRLAGHMVPTFQPAPSLHFITKFLNNEPY